MNNHYMGTQLSPEELQRQLAAQQQPGQRGQGRNVGMLNTASMVNPVDTPMSAMSELSMPGVDSLDDIISQNSHELHRRRSVPQPFDPSQIAQESPNRRVSMLDFAGPGGEEAYRNFPFGNIPMSDGLPVQGDAMVGGYGGLVMPGQSAAFPPSTLMALSDPADINSVSPDMIAFSNLNMDQMASDPTMNLFDPGGLGSQLGPDPAVTTFSADNTFGTAGPTQPVSMALGDDDMIMVDGVFDPSEGAVPSGPPRPNLSLDPTLPPYQPSLGPALSQTISNASAFSSPNANAPRSMPLSQAAVSLVNPATPASITSTVPSTADSTKAGKSLYSRSGFDMMRALWYVVSRKNPEVQLGAVDMSCAFVVCDVTMNDCPIIYVSDNFQNLTGYSRHEIVGKNCRFLQAPDGKVEAGSQREFVENDAVYRIKNKIAEGKEIQQSLINYRKGGKPFLNLLTMIPIPWDSDEIKYIIGFQIDLVECPDAITGNDAGGAMQVNYINNDPEQYIWKPPANSQWGPENGQTLAIDDVSTLLQQFNPSGVASEWHKQSWDKMLLENTDDVVHVLSLKGLFLYLSPSCKRVLEWDTSELVGTSLADICHPSDIIPATRELKDTGAGGTVDIAFRIRRKHSGYMWFESHGSLFVEQGKGRKCVILVGRRRPIYNLSRSALEAHGGIGDSEIWTKLSTSGMFLFVSSNVRSLLDLLPQNLVGTSMQEVMRKESRAEFGRAIEKVRLGKIASCKHEVHNKRGQVLQAESVFFPGDVPQGQKPTFILAKTRLLKASSRSHGSGSKSAAASVTSLPSEGQGSAKGRVSGFETASTDGKEQVTGISLIVASRPRDDDNIFGEFGTTKTSSWQYELRQMEKDNRKMAEDLALLLSNKKKRKRRKGGGNMVRDCANCHTRNTPEWRRGPSGNRDLCNSCGLRWAKQTGRVSPRNSSRGGNDAQSKKSNSPIHSTPLQRELGGEGVSSLKSPEGPTSNAGSGSDPGSATPKGANVAHTNLNANPPQSQPLLAGGSGAGGSGMEMEAIREERETSA